MNIVVAIKHIPSIADELPVKGDNVDFDSVDFVLNEFDEQSIEQAVLVKEAVGGTVTVIGVDLIEELDNVLHMALAKGADKAVKITADEPGADSHTQAKWLAEAIKGMSPDIVFAGVQASNDLDGQIGPMIAAYLDMPYIGGVSSVEVAGRHGNNQQGICRWLSVENMKCLCRWLSACRQLSNRRVMRPSARSARSRRLRPLRPGRSVG
jgi:electron transfer flavoprotein beta subunit